MRTIVFALLLVPAAGQLARADVTTFTDSNAFFAALGGTPSITEGYDTYAANMTIGQGQTLNGITYNFSPTPYSGFGVADPIGRIDTSLAGFGTGTLAAYRTPGSVTNGEDPTQSYFYPGESVTATFSKGTYAVGIFFNGDPVSPGDFFVQTAVGTAFNGSNPVTGDGSLYPTLYFVGLISTTPFTSATFGANGNALTGFNLDNLTYATNPAATPEPGSLAALCGLLAVGGLAYRRRVARVASA